jgi:hypothetical protein
MRPSRTRTHLPMSDIKANYNQGSKTGHRRSSSRSSFSEFMDSPTGTVLLAVGAAYAVSMLSRNTSHSAHTSDNSRRARPRSVDSRGRPESSLRPPRPTGFQRSKSHGDVPSGYELFIDVSEGSGFSRETYRGSR